jgi:hypothetical protein
MIVVMVGQVKQSPLLYVCHEQESSDKEVINELERHPVVLRPGVSVILLLSKRLVDEKFGMLVTFSRLQRSDRPFDITAYTLRCFVRFTAVKLS